MKTERELGTLGLEKSEKEEAWGDMATELDAIFCMARVINYVYFCW